jgi:hypothetical protein
MSVQGINSGSAGDLGYLLQPLFSYCVVAVVKLHSDVMPIEALGGDGSRA